MVLDEIMDANGINEKIIIPACTYEELKLKDRTLINSQIASSFIPWKSNTFFLKRTPRFLDFQEIWLLSKTGKMRKYDETATIAGHFKLYKNNTSSYNSESFNNARKEVQKTLVKNGYQLLTRNEHVSQIEIKWNLAIDKIRKQNSEWKVDDIVSGNIKNVDGISKTDIITFKVLHQTHKKFIIIFNTTLDWKKPIYKIREVEKINFAFNYATVLDKNVAFPTFNDINSDVINDKTDINTIVRRDSGFNENYDENCVNNINKNNDAKNSDTTNPFDNDDVIGDTTNSSFDNPNFVTNINNKLKTTINKPFLNHNKNDHNLSVSLNY